MADVHELYDQADQLKVDGKLEESVAKYAEILAVDPNYALAHAALAVVYGRLAKHDLAIEHARKVCEIAPDDPFSHTQLSVIYQRAYAGTNNPQFMTLRRRWPGPKCCSKETRKIFIFLGT